MSILAGLVAWICYTAHDAVKSGYRRFLEAVTVRAKLEDRLNMTKIPVLRPLSSERAESQPLLKASVNNEAWFAKEPLVTKRHLESRTWDKKKEKPIASSKGFVDAYLNQGMAANSKRFFLAAMGVAGVFAFLLLIKAVMLLLEPPSPKVSQHETTISVPSETSAKALNPELEKSGKTTSGTTQDTTKDKP